MVALTISPEAGMPSILVVEDDALLGAQISAILRELRFTVAGVASTAQEALSIAQVSMPQLALVDARLPGPIGGSEVAAMLRHRGIPTIILTGTQEAQGEPAANTARSERAITIPFRPSLAFKAISAALMAPRDDVLLAAAKSST